MEPVEPRSAMFFTELFSQRLGVRAFLRGCGWRLSQRLQTACVDRRKGRLGGGAEHEDVPEDGGGEQKGIDAVEEAAVTGQEGAGVFDADAAREGGLGEGAELGGDVEENGQEKELPPRPGGVKTGEGGVVEGEEVA